MMMLRTYISSLCVFCAFCLTACSSSDDAMESVANGGVQQFLNITISVSSGDQQVLNRAPQGGENGDGREAGFERENRVVGITLILADGPMGSNDAKVVFSRYFPVSETTGTYPADTHAHTDADIEKKYTTGDQRVSSDDIDLTKDLTYNIYVVANRDITALAAKGTLLQAALRNATLTATQLFNGNAYTPDGCALFVMASEQDVQVNFGTQTGVTKTEASNTVKYSVDNPILIERMAARIDFCTAYGSANAEYNTYSVTVGGTPTTVTGYKYNTIPAGSGYFILESITPFNIYNEQQYLFERVTTGWTGTPTTTYLGEETTGNYIVDPHTAEKSATTLNYLNPLSTTMEAAWQRSAASLNSQTSKTTVSTTNDNIVIAYCMENTLMPASPLKTYATGLAITGSYYAPDDKFLARKTVYGYLRHQGEASTPYQATELTAANLTADDRTCTVGTAMNFSVVRNNIYRVNIESVQTAGGWITLRMAEHDWRMVKHPQITM